MKPEHEKIMSDELHRYRVERGRTLEDAVISIITRIEALQDKPRRVLSEEAITNLWEQHSVTPPDAEDIKFIRRCITAEHALQLEPVMQVVRCRFYEASDGLMRCAVGDPDLEMQGQWIGDEFECEIKDGKVVVKSQI